MVLVCNLVTVLAMFVLGIIVGRIWEMRKEFRKNRFPQPHATGFSVPTARLSEPYA
jgi:hypothetical protein